MIKREFRVLIVVTFFLTTMLLTIPASSVTYAMNNLDNHVDIESETTLVGATHRKNLSIETQTQWWNKTYGGTGADSARSLVQTSDGGYTIAGWTCSFGVGGYDFYLIKIDSLGNIQWSRTYGGAGTDWAYSLVQTSDGGYAIAGYTDSFGVGGYDFYLVKTDPLGNMQWNKTYGGTGSDEAYSLVQTTDGGYAMSGITDSFGAIEIFDFYLVKTDANGQLQWGKTYGGAGDDRAYSLVQTGDGGYAMAGYTTSFGFGTGAGYLVKTDSFGNKQWDKIYANGVANSMVRTSDGGYAIAGGTGLRVYLAKTDSLGNMQWSKTYGGYDGLGTEEANSLVQTNDGGYAMTGYTNSFGYGPPADVYFVKTDPLGNMQWNETYGGKNNDEAFSLVQTSDGGYAMVGWTYSFGAGNWDIYLVKTNAQPVGERNIDIAVILAKFSDNNPAPIQDANFYLQGSDSLVSKLRRYYSNISYNMINLRLTFFNESNGAWKYKVDHDRIYYGSGKGNDLSDPNNRENEFTVDCISKADADGVFGSFDIVVCVHPGYDEAQTGSGGSQNDMWSQYFDNDLTTPNGYLIKNRIVLAEMDPMGTWAHEIGHALGKVLTGSYLRDRYGSAGNGEVGDWDLMGSGNWRVGGVGDRPSQMSAYSKKSLGWINPKVEGYGTYELNSIETLAQGDSQNVLIFYPGGLPFKPGSMYYLIESRTAISSYGRWENEWWAPDSGIVLYEITERALPPLTNSPDFVNKITISNRNLDEATLKSDGDFYVDPFSLVNFSFVQRGPKIDGYYSKVSINPWTPINLLGVKLSQAISQISIPLVDSNLAVAPDLDLHAFTSDGKHIGMNYSTGVYEDQVAGSVASGGLVGTDEWIFVPLDVNATYAVSSHDTGEFLKAYPQYQTQFQQQSFNVTYIYFDQAGNRYDSKFETLTISPNSTIQFSEVHDIAISNVVASKASVVQGDTVPINVTIKNKGTEAETFQVTCYTGNLTVGSQSVTLTPGSNTTLTFSWNTADVAPASYQIMAKVDQIIGDINPGDNTFDDGSVTIIAKPLTIYGFPLVWLIAIVVILIVGVALAIVTAKRIRRQRLAHA